MVSIRLARLGDVMAVCRLRKAAAEDLTRRFGPGHWSRISLANTIRRALDGGTLYVIEINSGAKLAGTFTLDMHMPGFYGREWFANPAETAFCCMRSMSIHPALQRKGTGRKAMQALEALARRRGIRAIRLDAYKGPAGAGAFYQKCGYTKVHEGAFNGVELEYFEKVLD